MSQTDHAAEFYFVTAGINSITSCINLIRRPWST